MAGSIPTTTSSWAISDTANKSITFATGMLEAATSDNISPIALRCCEAFGALLPLCVETRLKIEQIARRNHTSHVLNFIKAQIGYRKGDSVELLSRSDAGVRFLCLAATLCTLDHYDAASRLDGLLQATAQRDQVRPTIKQLQIMMQTMKTKLILSDFAKLVISCEIFARPMFAELGAEYAIENTRLPSGDEYGIATTYVPSKASLQELILALNELGRVGDVNSIEVSLKPQHLAWTWGFIQWFFGASPNIRTSSGKAVVEQLESNITLIVVPRSHNPRKRSRAKDPDDGNLEVTLQESVRSFRKILSLDEGESKSRQSAGLVDVRTWIKYQFTILDTHFPELRGNKEIEYAIGQAFYFIIAVVPDRLLFYQDKHAFSRTGPQESAGSPRDQFHPTSAKAFPSAELRFRVADDLLQGYIRLIHVDAEVEDVAILRHHNLAKQIEGACKSCRSPIDLDGTGDGSPCKVNALLEHVGTIAVTILMLTLFGSLPGIYPWILPNIDFGSPGHYDLRSYISSECMQIDDMRELATTGWSDLFHRRVRYILCPLKALFHSAGQLMNHSIRESTVISSKYGQVLYPAFFEAQEFMRHGYMQLCAFPGKLRKDNMEFDLFINDKSGTYQLGRLLRSGAIDAEEEDDEPDAESALRHDISDHGVGQRDSQQSAQSVDGFNKGEMVPADFSAPKKTSGAAMTWKLAVQDDYLLGKLFFLNESSTLLPCSAWSLIEAVARSRLTPPCAHKPDAPAGQIGHRFRMANSVDVYHRIKSHWASKDINVLCCVGRNYAKQIACLYHFEKYPPSVVHVDGCVSCALQLCEEGGSRVVIC